MAYSLLIFKHPVKTLPHHWRGKACPSFCHSSQTWPITLV